MSQLTDKLWEWFSNRSPKDVVNPNISTPMEGVSSCSDHPSQIRPIEHSTELNRIVGSAVKTGLEDCAARDANGQLLRNQDKISVLLGCMHVVQQVQAIDEKDRHIRGIAGRCVPCTTEFQKALEKGEVTPFDADRLSLVCTDCAKMTLSGQLCCLRHTTAIVGPDGTAAYLSPEDVETQKRQATINLVLKPFIALFQDNTPGQPMIAPPEDNKQSITNVFHGPVMLLWGDGKKKLPSPNNKDDTDDQET